MTLLTVNVVGASSPGREVAFQSFGEVLHTPPLLVRVGESVELEYEVVCPQQADEPVGECAPQGSVFVRSSGATSYDEVALEQRADGGLFARISQPYTAGEGFDYYAEVETSRGERLTLPPAGAAAPQHAWSVAGWTAVDLGSGALGGATAPSSTVAAFSWGKGPRMLGLDGGREQSRIGPSAFDVGPDGSLVVLDQVNDRLVIARPGAALAELPIDFDGGEGDLAVGADGTTYVLDAGGASPAPAVRSYGPAGELIAGTPVAEPVADMVRAGPAGPVVHTYPSEMWLPTGLGRPPLAPDEQIAAARAGRSVAGGLAVVVRASSAEARLALVRGDAVVRSWLVRSSASLGEVQLAEPYRDGLLVVVRLWDETRAAFRVLRLTTEGLADSFAVEPAEWAETASLSRFRLRGSTLYQLRSSSTGVEIAAFEIGGTE